MAKNLKKLLDNVISKYGKNELFPVPEIQWSDQYWTSRFGEYQFWSNTIIVSRLLNSPDIPDKVVESVIFHELTHQVHYGHTDAFMERMKDFPDYDKCNEWLEGYEFSLENTEPHPYDFQLNCDDETLYYEMPCTKANSDKYLSSYMYFNHLIVGQGKKPLSTQFSGKKYKQVIFIVRQMGVTYAVAWAKSVWFPKEFININHPVLGPKFAYDFVLRQPDILAFLPSNAVAILGQKEMPAVYKTDGTFTNKDLGKKIHSEIINLINSHDMDNIAMGSFDERLDAAPEIETNDVEHLINLSKEPDIGDRAVWIINCAVKKECSYRTIKALGDAYYSDWIFDKAKENYKKALELAVKENIPEREIKKVKELIISSEELENLIVIPN